METITAIKLDKTDKDKISELGVMLYSICMVANAKNKHCSECRFNPFCSYAQTDNSMFLQQAFNSTFEHPIII